jgi:hypothetical protein
MRFERCRGERIALTRTVGLACLLQKRAVMMRPLPSRRRVPDECLRKTDGPAFFRPSLAKAELRLPNITGRGAPNRGAPRQGPPMGAGLTGTRRLPSKRLRPLHAPPWPSAHYRWLSWSGGSPSGSCEVGVDVLAAQPVIGAEPPALHQRENPVNPWQDHMTPPSCRPFTR